MHSLHFRYLFSIVSIPTLKRSGRFGRIPEIGSARQIPSNNVKFNSKLFPDQSYWLDGQFRQNKPIEKPAGGFWRGNWRCQSLWSALLNALSAFQASNRPTSPQQQQYESPLRTLHMPQNSNFCYWICNSLLFYVVNLFIRKQLAYRWISKIFCLDHFSPSFLG